MLISQFHKHPKFCKLLVIYYCQAGLYMYPFTSYKCHTDRKGAKIISSSIDLKTDKGLTFGSLYFRQEVFKNPRRVQVKNISFFSFDFAPMIKTSMVEELI